MKHVDVILVWTKIRRITKHKTQKEEEIGGLGCDRLVPLNRLCRHCSNDSLELVTYLTLKNKEIGGTRNLMQQLQKILDHLFLFVHTNFTHVGTIKYKRLTKRRSSFIASNDLLDFKLPNL